MSNLNHLGVHRRRKGDFRLVTDCLCLNGSAHAVKTQDEDQVTCPRCKMILKLEKGGMSRTDARTKVIDTMGLTVTCLNCSGRNVEPLQGDEWECYDCGTTFVPKMA